MDRLKVKREEIMRAYRELTKCPCCGSNEFPHSCGCSPEIFNRTLQEVEIEGEIIPKVKLVKNKMWKIKKSIYSGFVAKENEGKLLMAVQAIILMMDVSIGDKVFRQYADESPFFYDLFEKEVE